MNSQVKFKALGKKDPFKLYLSEGWAFTYHFAFKADWLLNLPRRRNSNGLLQLQNKVAKQKAAVVVQRLTGEYKSPNIGARVAALDFAAYSEVGPNEFKAIDGHFYGNLNNPGKVAVKIRDAYLDVEYFVATTFDPSTRLFYYSKNSPLLLVNNSNEIVALLMVLDPDKFHKLD